jgi:hypothetical protein
VNTLLLLVSLTQPAVAADFWSLDGPPVELASTSTVRPASLSLVLPHGPDNSSGADVPAGGFKYKKKKKPILSYIGGGLATAGLLYLASSRSLGFEVEDAATPSERDDILAEQQTKKTIGLSLLGTAGVCFVVDIFI